MARTRHRWCSLIELRTVYAYSPYGEVAVLGPDGGNDLQYAGLKNDGTGLYQAMYRYYDPVLKQWISEDPIGMAGGPNLRQYVGANPISFNDPLGLADVRIDNAMRAAGMPPPKPATSRPPLDPNCPDCMNTCLMRVVPWGVLKGGASSLVAHFVGGVVAAADLTLAPIAITAGSVYLLDKCSKECGLETGTITPFNITAP